MASRRPSDDPLPTHPHFPKVLFLRGFSEGCREEERPSFRLKTEFWVSLLVRCFRGGGHDQLPLLNAF